MNRLYTGGTFDMFHPGHVNFLKQCQMISDHVTVSLNTDEFVESYKGRPPICSYEERAAMLNACCYVDGVIKNVGGADSKPAIDIVAPQIIAIGSDWAKRDYHSQMGFTQEWLDERRISLIYITYTSGISTTELKRRVLENSGNN